MEEMKGVQQRAEKFSKEVSSVASERGKVVGAEVGTAARRGVKSLGDVIVFLLKVFVYFVLGCIAFAFVIALFAFAIAAIGLFPMKDFVLNAGWQNVFAWGTLLFFIAAPIIGIITWIIRRIAKIKTRRKMLRLTFLGLWIIGLASFIGLIVSVGRDFRSSNTLLEEDVTLINPLVSRIEITSSSPDQKFYRNRWFEMEPFKDLDEDTAYVQNVSVHIIKSPNDSFRVTILKMVSGKSRRYADTLAQLMNYNVEQRDSLLLIDRGIAITRNNKFRNQRVVLTVYVPVGKHIRVDRSVGWSRNVRFEGPWSDEWDVDFEDIEHGWEEGIDYVMRDDGLYTVDGNPADSWKHPRKESSSGDSLNTKPDGYRYDQRLPGDSGKQKALNQYMKDSLQREKDKLEKEIEKIKIKDESTVINTFSLQVYSPMLLMK
jgi:hypothetical protein